MEVERKVKLEGDDLGALRRILDAEGVDFGPATTQRDVYYKEAGFRTRVQGVDGYIVRVRHESSGCSLNLKRLTRDPGVWREVETAVSDGEAGEAILQAIGLEHAVTVTKSRQQCHLGRIEVILDEIAELGAYLELAVEGNDLDVAAAKEELGEVLDRLGVGRERIEFRGYPTILLEQQGVVFSV